MYAALLIPFLLFLLKLKLLFMTFMTRLALQKNLVHGIIITAIRVWSESLGAFPLPRAISKARYLTGTRNLIRTCIQDVFGIRTLATISRFR